MQNNTICDKCKDTYYIIGESTPEEIRPIERCTCKASKKALMMEWLNRNKKYIQIAIQNGDIAMDDVIKILTP